MYLVLTLLCRSDRSDDSRKQDRGECSIFDESKVLCSSVHSHLMFEIDFPHALCLLSDFLREHAVPHRRC
jgi:hypothetical protein